jgi:hypothetical protein
VRAERKLGQILQSAKATGHLDKNRNLEKGPEVVAVDLGEISLFGVGISRDLSSRARCIANVAGQITKGHHRNNDVPDLPWLPCNHNPNRSLKRPSSHAYLAG